MFPRYAALHSQQQPYLALIAPSLLGTAVLIGLLLWGLGIWFAFLAVVSIAAQFRESGGKGKEGGTKTAVFNMGWWAFTCVDACPRWAFRPVVLMRRDATGSRSDRSRS